MKIDPIIQQLKKLRNIEPEREFLVKSKNVILLSNINQPKFFLRKYAGWLSLSFAVFCLVLIFIVYPIRKSSLPIASAETLSREFEDLSINITLKNVNYSQNMNQTINSAISAIANNKAAHLDHIVLEQEFQKIENNNSSSTNQTSTDQIDNLLNQILN